MKEHNKRWRVLAFVAMGLVLAGLLSLSSSAWATPGQDALRETILLKDAEVCAPREPDDVVFKFTFANGDGDSENNGDEDWENVEFTDQIDPLLTIDKVTVACQPAPCPADTSASGPGVNPVKVTMGAPPNSLPANSIVFITIECTAQGYGTIGNTGTVEFDDQWFNDQTRSAGWRGQVRPCEEFVPEMSSVLLLGGGLVGLAGYAGTRWRARRR